MVAHLVRLKVRLLANGMRRSTGQLVGVVIGSLYFLGVVVLLGFGAFASAEQNPIPDQLSILAGSALVLGWALIPPLLTGVDLTLEPSRFVVFGIEQKTLSRALIVAGFISIPAVLSFLGLIAAALMWRMQPVVLLLAVLAALGTTAMAVLLCQLLTISATALRAKRRFREITFALFFLLVVLLGPLLSTLISAAESILDWINPLAAVLAYTPLGAFAALPGAAAAGDYGRLALCAVLALVYLGGLIAVLMRASAAAAIAPPPQQKAATASGLGTFKWLPATPAGAVAARALTYWLKDPRYAISVLMVPVLPIIFWFTAGQSGSFTAMYFLGPLIGILLGFAISADVSYDSTAFALHVLTGVRGRSDRLGRAAACFMVGIVPLLLAAILPGALMGQAWRIPMDLGLSLAAFLVGLGVSSVASARYTYSVPLPGDNPMKTPPGNGLRMALTQLGIFAVMFVLLLPVAVPYILGWVGGSMPWPWITLAIGVLWGAGLLVAGVLVGGRWFERRTPELMQAVVLNK